MEAQEAARNAAATAATERGEERQQQPNGDDGSISTIAAEAPDGEQTHRQEQQEPGQEDSTRSGAMSRTLDTTQLKTTEMLAAITPGYDKNFSHGERAFAKVSALDFGPALYKVVKEDGATFWAGDLISGSLVATRTIPKGNLVLCQELQRHQLDGETTYLLRIPGGWVREDAVKHIRKIVKNQDGQWA